MVVLWTSGHRSTCLWLLVLVSTQVTWNLEAALNWWSRPPCRSGAWVCLGDASGGLCPNLRAASCRYLNEERLANMVGSLHVWEPNVRVVVYSLGLSEEVRRAASLTLPQRHRGSLRLGVCVWLGQSMATLRTWRNVEVKQLPLDTLPPHVADFRGSYSFKSWIISRELELHHACVARWLAARVQHGLACSVRAHALTCATHMYVSLAASFGLMLTWRYGGHWTSCDASWR